MMDKKWWIGSIIVVGCLIAALLLATEKKENIDDAQMMTEQITLPVLISGGDASWENCMKEVAAAYMEKHPEVKVEVVTTMNQEGTDYTQSLLIEEALGNFKGIVEMRNAESFASEGKIAPLPKKITKLLKYTQTYEEETYTVSRFYTCRGIIYNKRVFEKLNLEVPKTYQEFLRLCKKLKANGISPLVVGAGDTWHLQHLIDGLFGNDVKQKFPDWIRQRNAGKVHWTDEEPVKMLTQMQQLFQDGNVEENYRTTTDAGTIEVLTQGRAAMLYSGTWMFSQIAKADPQFEIGWFFLPQDDGEPIVEYDGIWGWSLSAECVGQPKLYDTAINFLEFYYSKDIYQKVLQNMNGISSLKEVRTYPAIPVQEDIMEQVQKKGIWQTEVLGLSDTPEGFMSNMYANILNMIDGHHTARETAKILDKEWDEKLEENQ